jgi:Kef-type K+ transport system membrane component KefB/Trk K+ transport system NAD-binding subunit
MDNSNEFVVLLLIAILAVILPILVNKFRKIKLPIVVAEIIAGMMIGRSGLNIVQPTTTLNFLTEFGFIFLMFLSGIEVSFQSIGEASKSSGPWWRKPMTLGILYFLITLALSLGIGYSLVFLGMVRDGMLMGLILSTTSMGIVVPVLKERKIITSSYGQLILFSAIVSDFVTLVLLSLDIAIISRGFTLDLLFFLVLIAVFIVTFKLGTWAKTIPFIPRIIEELGHATAQIEVRGAFAIMIALVVLSDALGVELILGAFLAGVIISLIIGRGETQLHQKLDAIGYGFFIPIFFITVGAQFDLGSIIESPSIIILMPILLISTYAVKIIPSLLFTLSQPFREALAAGALLSSRMSLIIAASAIAFELGIVTQAVNSTIILVAIITCTASPLIFNRLKPHVPEARRSGVVILGTNQLAELLCARLTKSGEGVVVVGRDQKQLNQLSNKGYRTIQGEPSSRDVLEKAGLRNARSFVILSNSQTVILETVNIARELGVPSIIARSDDPRLALELTGQGVRVVQPAMAVALALEGALHFPVAFDVLMDQGDDVELRDVPLINSSLFGKTLRQIQLPGNALIIGIRRASEVIVPDNDTVMSDGDILLLIGSVESLEESEAFASYGGS